MESTLDIELPSISKVWRADMDRFAKKKGKAVSLGVSFLDEAFEGGLYPGDLCLLAAPTGFGKTTIATMAARNAASNGKRVVFFALEAEKGEISARIIKQMGVTKSPMRAICYGKEVHYIQEPDEKVLENIRVYCNPEREFTVDDLDRWIAQTKDITDLYVLDHFHFLTFKDSGGSEIAEHKRAIQKIRSVALEYEKPILVLAHINKSAMSSDKWLPTNADFYGTGDLTKVATKCVLLSNKQPPAYSVDANDPASRTTVYISKCRVDGSVSGYAALMKFDFRTCQYDEKYTLVRATKDGPLVLPARKPEWAKNVLDPRELDFGGDEQWGLK